jgi:hypothetical protein
MAPFASMKTSLLVGCLCFSMGAACPAGLLTSFSDDFNRSALGSNYTVVRGAPYGISGDQVLTNGGPGQNHTSLTLGTLPTAQDYARGYSFEASLDIFIPTSGQASVVTAGLVLHEQMEARGQRDRLFRFRGHDAKHCAVQLMGGRGVESADMGQLKKSTWYTMRISSAAPGAYTYAFSQHGSARPIASGTFTETGTNILTGGNIGFYTENGRAGTYYFGHFSVKVARGTQAEPQRLLLFSGPQDITNTWGAIEFGTTPLQQAAACSDPGFTLIYSEKQKDGSCLVLGSAFHPDPDIKAGKLTDSGADMARAKSTWDVVRAMTSDGMRFENVETVFTAEPANWSAHCAIAYNPSAKQFLLLRLAADNNGFGYRAFFSPDGKTWKLHSMEPLFYDGDAMSVFWSPRLERYVCVSKSLQPVTKHLEDHGGASSLLKNNKLRDRRVLVFRSSRDGIHWEPSVSMDDVWDRSKRKKAVPVEFMTMPDAEDPPDLEFYSGNGFWYFDRAYMMVLNYAASPLVHGHGPHLDTEWWAASDGLRWERPGRGINATGAEITRITHNPMVLEGKLKFHYGNRILEMPEDRISYVGARANAEFSTRLFQMPRGDLFLNAAVPSPQRPFASLQAYLMVDVVDEHGKVIPGFEAAKCTITKQDAIDLPLVWSDKSARELAGRNIRLRFHLRSANVYAVTARES